MIASNSLEISVPAPYTRQPDTRKIIQMPKPERSFSGPPISKPLFDSTWYPELKTQLTAAESFACLQDIALQSLRRLGSPKLNTRCGARKISGEEARILSDRDAPKNPWAYFLAAPLFKGGMESVEGNMMVSLRAINVLRKEGKKIFDHFVFYEMLQKIFAQNGEGDFTEIVFADFFAPLLETRVFSNVCMFPNWKTSPECRAIYDHAKKLGITVSNWGRHRPNLLN